MPIVPDIGRPRRQVRSPLVQVPTVREAPGTQAAAAASQAGSRLASLVARRAEERDTAKARNAFNQFRRQARDEMTAAKQLRGADAYGTQGRYDQWYADNTGKFSETLENDRQRQAFQNMAADRLEADARNLGAYELEQHLRYQADQFKDSVATAEADIAVNPFDTDMFDAVVDDLEFQSDELNAGFDNTAEKEAIRADLTIKLIQNQLAVDPMKARDTLEKYRSHLGGAYAKMKNQVDTEALVLEANHIFPESADDRYDWVNGMKDVSSSVKTSVLNRLEAQQSEQQERDRAQLKANRRADEDAFYSAIGNGDMVGAMKVADSMSDKNWSQKEIFQFKKAAVTPVFKNDKVAEANLQQQIFGAEITSVSELISSADFRRCDGPAQRALVNSLNSVLDNDGVAESEKAKANLVQEYIKKFDRITADGTPFESYNAMRPTFVYELKTMLDREEATKGSPLTLKEVRNVGEYLTERLVHDTLRPFDEVEYARIFQIIDPKKFPQTLRTGERKKFPQTLRTGERKEDAAARRIPDVSLATEGGLTPEEIGAEPPAASPEKVFVESIPTEIRASMMRALINAGRTTEGGGLLYKDMWDLYSNKFPEEARRIAETRGL